MMTDFYFKSQAEKKLAEILEYYEEKVRITNEQSQRFQWKNSARFMQWYVSFVASTLDYYYQFCFVGINNVPPPAPLTPTHTDRGLEFLTVPEAQKMFENNGFEFSRKQVTWLYNKCAASSGDPSPPTAAKGGLTFTTMVAILRLLLDSNHNHALMREVTKLKETLWDRYRSGQLVFDPESRFVFNWTLGTLVQVVYSAFLIPTRYLPPPVSVGARGGTHRRRSPFFPLLTPADQCVTIFHMVVRLLHAMGPRTPPPPLLPFLQPQYCI
jgi:hypothetical protein